ncbi:putative permease/ATP- binding protein cydc [Rana grylio virus]|uniref:Putative permease/ATP-binding protein cydc n=1 Tax=Rana grylio virus TaxID=380178 RepID=H9XFN4_FRG3V|nr:putative permease/ATP- binding protein cydc [Rana grylio virus]
MTAPRGPGEQRDQPDQMDPLVHPVTSVRSGPWERLGLRGRGESRVLRETLELWEGQEGLISRVRDDPRETWDRKERLDSWPRVGGRDTPSRVHVRHSVCGAP